MHFALRNYLFAALSCAIAASALSADWPQYRHDGNRSSVTEEALPSHTLSEAWSYKPAQFPTPAWPEPGRELHRMDFDYAPQVVSADGRAFFNSTADDTVRCVDLKTGKMLWQFTTNAPVRFAPAIDEGRLYVASDDGCLYCLAAEKGDLLWKFKAAPSEDMLLGNGRMISRWPLRGGVVVRDGIVYTVAGMWPDEGVHLYGLDGKTGEIVWRNDSSGSIFTPLPHPAAMGFSGVAPQGYLSVSADRLLTPTGRGIPAVFDRVKGDLVRFTPGDYAVIKDGGSWTCIFEDVFFDRLNMPGHGLNANRGEVKPLQSDGISCIDMASGKKVFMLPYTTEVLPKGNRLYAAGGESLVAYDLAELRKGTAPEKCVIWSMPHERTYCLAMAGDALLAGSAGSVEAYDANTGKQIWKGAAQGQVRGIALADGHLIVSTNKGMVSTFTASTGSTTQAVLEASAPTSEPTSEPASQPTSIAPVRYDSRDGYALVIGENAADVAKQLIQTTKLHVIHPVSNQQAAAAERDPLIQNGSYGSRLAVPVIDSNKALPLASYFADRVIVADANAPFSPADIYRCVHPCGGSLEFRNMNAEAIRAWIAKANAPEEELKKDANGEMKLVRGQLQGAGTWSRAMADAGKTLVSNDKRITMPLQMLWFGGPGPDRMMDRHAATTPPVSVNGRVFVTGQNDLIAFDAYNGRELWDVPLKGVGRTSGSRTSGNMLAEDGSVFVVVKGVCYRFNQETGVEEKQYTIPKEVGAEDLSWEYIEVNKGLIIGSTNYVAKKNAKPVDWKTKVFALDEKNGALKWQYATTQEIGLAAIAVGADRVYLQETPDAKGQAKRRGQEVAKPELVALNALDGQPVWRQSENVPADQQVQYADGVVAVCGSSGYDAATGKPLWSNPGIAAKQATIQGDSIINMPYSYDLKTGKQRMIKDQLTRLERPWEMIKAYGCGRISGATDMLFFRSGASAFYDMTTDGTTNFGGVKPNCGVSMIAANGLVIMPEASSGCSCSYNYQTTLALMAADDQQREKWFVLPGDELDKPHDSLRIALGAPGDRKDQKGNAWLGYPRPAMTGAAPLQMEIAAAQPDWYRHPRKDKLPADQEPWLYATGLRNPGKFTLNLFPKRPMAIVNASMQLDGSIDATVANANNGQYTMKFFPYREGNFAGMNFHDTKSDLYFSRDDQNLYIAIQSPSPMITEGRKEWARSMQGKDAHVWEDDSWEVFLADPNAKKTIHLGVSASGATYDALWQKGQKFPDVKWNPAWDSKVSTDDQKMVVEIAMPWKSISEAGLDPKQLQFNACGTGPHGLGAPDMGLNPERFSVIYSGNVQIDHDDEYTFYLSGDDLNSLSIDGKELLNFESAWHPFPSTIDTGLEKSAKVKLAKGSHSIQVTHGERAGTTELHLAWSTANSPKAIIPASAFTTADGKPGLQAEYWDTPWLGYAKDGSGPRDNSIMKASVPNIDFTWGPSGWRSELVSTGEARKDLPASFIPLAYAEQIDNSVKKYTVRLHFAELDGIQPGQRVFDLKLQGNDALKALDIAKESGGSDKPLVKEVKDVPVTNDSIEVEMTPCTVNGELCKEPPILSAIEVTKQ